MEAAHLAAPFLAERGFWTTFAFGASFVFFTGVATGAAFAAKAACTTSILTAVFGEI
jgi:hypothetical protein